MLDDIIVMLAIDFLPKPLRIGCYTLMVLVLVIILGVWLSDR